jgi:hypothetical protein
LQGSPPTVKKRSAWSRLIMGRGTGAIDRRGAPAPCRGGSRHPAGRSSLPGRCSLVGRGRGIAGQSVPGRVTRRQPSAGSWQGLDIDVGQATGTTLLPTEQSDDLSVAEAPTIEVTSRRFVRVGAPSASSACECWPDVCSRRVDARSTGVARVEVSQVEPRPVIGSWKWPAAAVRRGLGSGSSWRASVSAPPARRKARRTSSARIRCVRHPTVRNPTVRNQRPRQVMSGGRSSFGFPVDLEPCYGFSLVPAMLLRAAASPARSLWVPATEAAAVCAPY